ncbi:MAG TPA: caspase family protein [Accumulibacter sp.]|uniref:caspase family protein n=1 Tax=Accumulibacter sp. TaxID=2053492 RepID=UPI002879CEB0|nr:caspase family protein [Accumulibacter sp.]MDS4056290.1 caspase family protein [Accumulibacter sp.]HMV05050.1 caspase family protein [Accumulibacter sp.]HMW63153.1 caspase family protein [Accumulibacter sp.]HMW78845.1 caspase family protein [Accumulibacter sp.]HMX67916.1 caspase family protein [Accumulibacter sp.]
MANKKALFVGINKFANYPQFALNGCVNDAKDMAALYKDLLGFKATEMSTLTDSQATKANIMDRLNAMVAEAKAGKLNYLVFSLSSHGTQMNDTSGDEPDGKDEAFVPYDIAEKAGAWDPAHIISDDELHDLFVQLPANVLLEVYLDTCHSGSGLRGAEFGLHAPRPRYVAPPDHEFTKKSAKMRGFTLGAGGKKGAASAEKAAVAGANHVLWTGCKANETSADAYFNGRYNGAFTYYLVKVMRETQNKLSRKQVISKMRAQMKSGFSQNPQLEGNATNRTQAIIY